MACGEVMMQPSEFLDTAERLAQGATEGDWRSAISRAYYAVFHVLGEFFLAHGLDLGQGGQAHNNLYIGLYNCGIAAAAVIGTSVDNLRTSRVTADYVLNASITSVNAGSRVQEARQIVADFQALLATVPAQQLVDGVRQFLQSIGRLPRP